MSIHLYVKRLLGVSAAAALVSLSGIASAYSNWTVSYVQIAANGHYGGGSTYAKNADPFNNVNGTAIQSHFMYPNGAVGNGAFQNGTYNCNWTKPLRGSK